MVYALGGKAGGREIYHSLWSLTTDTNQDGLELHGCWTRQVNNQGSGTERRAEVIGRLLLDLSTRLDSTFSYLTHTRIALDAGAGKDESVEGV